MPQIYLDLPGMDQAAAKNTLYQEEVNNLPARRELMRSQGDLAKSHARIYQAQAASAERGYQDSEQTRRAYDALPPTATEEDKINIMRNRALQTGNIEAFDRIDAARSKLSEKEWETAKKQTEMLADTAVGHIEQYRKLVEDNVKRGMPPNEAKAHAWGRTQSDLELRTLPFLRDKMGLKQLPKAGEVTLDQLDQMAGMKGVLANYDRDRGAKAKADAAAKTSSGGKGGAKTSFVQIHELLKRDFPGNDNEETLALARKIHAEGKYNPQAAAITLKAAGMRDEKIFQFIKILEGNPTEAPRSDIPVF